MIITPLLSVILPAYNVEKYIYETIQSILKQSFTDYELLIFDDGSTDSTVEIIKSFLDPRIILYSDGENKGYVDRLNTLLSLAKGKFVARMDADDICRKNRFEEQINFLNSNEDCDVLGTYANTFYYSPFFGFLYPLPTSNRQIETYLLFDSPMVHPSVMFRGDLIKSSLYEYNKEAYPAEDFELWVSLKMAGKNLQNINQKLIDYRRHFAQTSVKNLGLATKNSFKIKKKYFQFCLNRDLKVEELQCFESVWLNPSMANVYDWQAFLNLYIELLDIKIYDNDCKKIIVRKLFGHILNSENKKVEEILLFFNNSILNSHHKIKFNYILKSKIRVIVKKGLQKLFLI